LLMACLNQLLLLKPYVSFYFDSNFTMENPVSRFTRSVIFWGSPLPGASDEETYKSSSELLKQ